MATAGENHLVIEPEKGVKKDRIPVIFLHPMFCTKEIWKDILQPIANNTRSMAYAYDARCHGVNKYMKDFSFGVLVDDLTSFMTLYRIEKAVLVGHSMGAKTAISFALKHPKKVDKVIIIDMNVEKIPEQFVRRSIKFLGLWRDAVQSLPKSTPVENITSKSVQVLYSLSEEEEGERMEIEKQAYFKSEFIYTKLADGKYDVSYNPEELRKGLEKYLEEKEEISGTYCGPASFYFGTESLYKIDEEKDSIKKFFPEAKMKDFKGDPRNELMKSVFVPRLIDLLD